MSKIQNILSGLNPPTIYIDTVVVWFPYTLPIKEWWELQSHGEVWPMKSKYGVLLVTHRPTKKMLMAFEAIAKRRHGILSRFDVALDWQCANTAEASTLRELILTSCLLRWRRKAPMLDWEEETITNYWTDLRLRPKRISMTIKSTV
jgi:hypothetical protein